MLLPAATAVTAARPLVLRLPAQKGLIPSPLQGDETLWEMAPSADRSGTGMCTPSRSRWTARPEIPSARTGECHKVLELGEDRVATLLTLVYYFRS